MLPLGILQLPRQEAMPRYAAECGLPGNHFQIQAQEPLWLSSSHQRQVKPVSLESRQLSRYKMVIQHSRVPSQTQGSSEALTSTVVKRQSRFRGAVVVI